MSIWPTIALRDTAAEKGLVGGPFGSSLGGKDYVDNGVPVIRGTNLNCGRELGGDFVYVSESKVSTELARNIAEPTDLVFTPTWHSRTGGGGTVGLSSKICDFTKPNAAKGQPCGGRISLPVLRMLVSGLCQAGER